MFDGLFASKRLRIESEDTDVVGAVHFLPGVGKQVDINGNRVLTTADGGGGITPISFTGVCTVSFPGDTVTLGTITANPGGVVTATNIPFRHVQIGKMCFISIPSLQIAITTGTANQLRLSDFTPPITPPTSPVAQDVCFLYAAPPNPSTTRGSVVTLTGNSSVQNLIMTSDTPRTTFFSFLGLTFTHMIN